MYLLESFSRIIVSDIALYFSIVAYERNNFKILSITAETIKMLVYVMYRYIQKPARAFVLIQNKITKLFGYMYLYMTFI